MPSPSTPPPPPLPPRAKPLAPAALDAVFSALAHPARRQILLILHARGGVMTAGEIADRFKHAWPTTTRHLAVLQRAGVLESIKHGRERHYTLRPQLLVDTAAWLHNWAAATPEPHAPSDRPDWTALPYATMRNTTPPADARPARRAPRSPKP